MKRLFFASIFKKPPPEFVEAICAKEIALMKLRYFDSFSLTIGGISIILSNIILGHLFGIYGIAFVSVVGETVLNSSLYYNIRKSIH